MPRHPLEVNAFERQPTPKTCHYGVSQHVVLKAAERVLPEEDETQCQKLWLHAQLWASTACVNGDGLPFTPHGDPGAF